MSNFTEEQRIQLKVLNKKYALKGLGLVGKAFIALVLANFLVAAADILYLHSKFFVFIMSFAAGFSFSKLVLDNFRFLGEDLKVETLKILEEKTEK